MMIDNGRRVNREEMGDIIAALRDSASANSGTSKLTVLIPPNSQLAQIKTRLNRELETTYRFKSKVNRKSAEDAINKGLRALSELTKIPPNGLALFCGEMTDESGRDRMKVVMFEPCDPMNTSLLLVDARFHEAYLSEI
jgi:peptide chain release factor subunit 1